jgi:Glycosyltransferase family 9 (heptosyltransferase)
MPYLGVPPYLSVPRLDSDEALKVGVAWAGHPTHQNDHHRSCPREHLKPLFALPGVRYYCLQTPLSGEEADWLETHGVVNLEPELTAYARTAALIIQLDLVVSVDTSVAHLAGALGKPVWILLGQHSDWRWLIDREDSPWYPTARLFRQRQPGEINDPFAGIGSVVFCPPAKQTPRTTRLAPTTRRAPLTRHTSRPTAPGTKAERGTPAEASKRRKRISGATTSAIAALAV